MRSRVRRGAGSGIEVGHEIRTPVDWTGFLQPVQSTGHHYGDGAIAGTGKLDMPSCLRRVKQRVHHIQHVICHLAAGAMRAAGSDGCGHIGHAQAAALLAAAFYQRHILPLARFGPPQAYGSIKRVWIGTA